jgi:hypothetical protein
MNINFKLYENFKNHDILEKAKLGDSKMISGYQGLGKGGMNKRNTEDSGTILYDIMIVNMCHYTFVKARRTVSQI